jgi:hypothetical protein
MRFDMGIARQSDDEAGAAVIAEEEIGSFARIRPHSDANAIVLLIPINAHLRSDIVIAAALLHHDQDFWPIPRFDVDRAIERVEDDIGGGSDGKPPLLLVDLHVRGADGDARRGADQDAG